MKKYTKFDNYSDCIEYLFELERVGIKYDLINIKKLLRFLENPQNYFQSIHIAGTNGKGSVAAMLNSILIELTHPGQKMRNDRQECLSHQINN
jgi:folylpolyglutamate synthase/dihydropteroate synthase